MTGAIRVFRMPSNLSHCMRCGCVLIACVLFASLAGVAVAHADRPWWTITPTAEPSYLPPGGTGRIILIVNNLGDADAVGSTSPITISDGLPAGLTATSIKGGAGSAGVGGPATCSLTSLSCTFAESIEPYAGVYVEITVKVAASAQSAMNAVAVSGGGARSVSVSLPVRVQPGAVPFGMEHYEMNAEGPEGLLETQAGSHPFQLTTTLSLNTKLGSGKEEPGVHPAGMAKDLTFHLPPGLIGNPTPFPKCSDRQFTSKPGGEAVVINECPVETVVGVAIVTVRFGNASGGRPTTLSVPLYSLEPSFGEPAKFGFYVLNSAVTLDTGLDSGGDYGVEVTVHNISQQVEFLGNQVVFWGYPADARHDLSRGWACAGGPLVAFHELQSACVASGSNIDQPLLTLPTSCTGELMTSVTGDSWTEPGAFTAPVSPPSMVSLDGCGRLGFAPEIKLTPDGQAASTPTGLTVDVHVPQQEGLDPFGAAESDVRNTTVTLPDGVVLNPSSADGLQACSESQVGYERLDPGSETQLFTSSLPAPFCPDASKVGTVRVTTPLLPEPLEGAAYLAEQTANPFGSLLALYLVFEDKQAGVLVKLTGEVVPDPVTGQLVSTFKNTPQLPFNDLELHFFGGERAPLATPAKCGAYTTTASIVPWAGEYTANSSSTFHVTSGPDGRSCADPLPFNPSLTGGTTSIQAGGFSPFTMTMSRQDGEQGLQAIQLRMPPGLLGMLSSVKLCEEPQADQGTCGADSQIGETIVSVGVGGEPYSVKGGRVYITGPYRGAPYGLSIVNPAVAGPFNLGTVVVRAAINVDPTSSVLTVTSDASGPYRIPHIIDGIPLQIKHVNVTINRPGFTFNPTNCTPQTIGAILSSTEGSASQTSVPFQVTNCATLGFKPIFTVFTSGKTSRARGASLDVKLTYPPTRPGTLANIAKVKVDLPKQLPSRLTTLQKACPAAVFNANPANCPPASVVGIARATTPVLPGMLAGPVYFVSHGGEEFPNLIVVLQTPGGVRVDLVGDTFIDKAGITSSTFKQIPDVPVSTFELYLPQGPDSALAANGNLCNLTKIIAITRKITRHANGRTIHTTQRTTKKTTATLTMPTVFTAQNGMVIHQNTRITVTSCPGTQTAKTARNTRRARVVGKQAQNRKGQAR